MSPLKKKTITPRNNSPRRNASVSPKQNADLSPKKNVSMSSKPFVAKGKGSTKFGGKKGLIVPKGCKLPWKFFYGAKLDAYLVATLDLEKCNKCGFHINGLKESSTDEFLMVYKKIYNA